MSADYVINSIAQPTDVEKYNAKITYNGHLYNNKKSTKLYDISTYDLSNEMFELIMKHRYEILDYLSEKHPEDFL